MDILSFIGLALAVCAIVIGAILKGAGVKALLSAAAFMIVIVGTIAAICVQTPMPVMKHAMRILPWVFRPPAFERTTLLKKIVEWSNTARKQGLLGLEPIIEKEPDDFVRKGFSAGRVTTTPGPSPAIDWTKPGAFYIGDRKVATWDPAEHAEEMPNADVPTRDPDRRLAAHSKHLQTLDKRLKRLERGA